MPFQNRVDPLGEIHAVAARGQFTGNRGTIHDAETQTLRKRRWATKMWIICDCGFQGRKRNVMGRNRPQNEAGTAGPGWTNLFFLDEVTALAAGHRPCFECRRPAARSYADAFAKGQGVERISAPQMDAILHPQRRAAGAAPVPLRRDQVLALPDGALVVIDGKAHAVRNGALLSWTFEGYGPGAGKWDHAELLTPPATVAALSAGYLPVWRN